jgi:arginase
MPNTILIGAPIDEGQRRAGCVMGPTAYRVAGLGAAIADLGHGVQDWGDVALPELRDATCPNPAVHSLREVLGWTEVLADKVDDALSQGGTPIILGGDHSLALGSVAGAAAVPVVAGCPFRFPHAADHHLWQPAWHACGLYCGA